MVPYVLFIPLRADLPTKNIDWRQLAGQFNLTLISEYPTQVTVEANSDAIARLHQAHPEIQVTVLKKYHKHAAF